MSKFNVGNMVRVIKDSNDNPIVSALGCIGIVESNGSLSGLPCGASISYTDDCLELVAATTTNTGSLMSAPAPSQAQLLGGIPLRDQFAMAALTGLLAKGGNGCDVHPAHATHGLQLPKLAYAYADAMLKARQ